MLIVARPCVFVDAGVGACLRRGLLLSRPRLQAGVGVFHACRPAGVVGGRE